jgi:FixJ family two-component response regulator
MVPRCPSGYDRIVVGDSSSNESAQSHVVAAVDDDFRVRESIESLVASAGHTPLVFASAEEFLQSGAPELAICLITEVRMPGIDGLELQRRLKLQYPRLPVIFVTAHYDDEIRRRALNQGAAAFLYKPFDAADLLGAIDLALGTPPED